MNTRFINARILQTKDDGTFSVMRGELWVENNRIRYIGDGSDTPDPLQWDRTIDVKDNLIMPGMKNAHSHTAMTFLRSYADNSPLQEWLYEKVIPRESLLTADDLYIMDVLGIMEYLSAGITSNFDMYLHTDTNVKASVDTGFRTVLCDGLNDFGGTVAGMEADYNKYNSFHERISYCMGIHAEYTTKKESIEEVVDLIHHYQAPAFLHLSETKREVDECYERYGISPVKLMDELGFFDFGGGGFHCVWVDEEDIAILARRNLTAVINSASNLKLASGIAPVKALLDAGVNLALGTDGAASNNALDLFREMYLTSTLAKVREQDPTAVSAQKVLYMATAGGAKAMGLNDCDRLAVDKLADLIILDLAQPNMQPENSLLDNIVYSGYKGNVKLTMINGRILYEDGRFDIGFDPDDIYKKANAIITRMNRKEA